MSYDLSDPLTDLMSGDTCISTESGDDNLDGAYQRLILFKIQAQTQDTGTWPTTVYYDVTDKIRLACAMSFMARIRCLLNRYGILIA